jgi:hypothetical protein
MACGAGNGNVGIDNYMKACSFIVKLTPNCGSDKSTVSMIYTAAVWAKAVYTETKVGDYFEEVGMHHRVRHAVNQSVSGGIKTTIFTGIRRSVAPSPVEDDLCHVIAVKGSKRIVDHLVNLNCEPTVTGANGVVQIMHPCLQPELTPLQIHPTLQFKSHKGFESCAAALQSHVQTYLEGLPSGSRVLFTGHSAGGAVAALLFTHFVTYPRSKNSQSGCADGRVNPDGLTFSRK